MFLMQIRSQSIVGYLLITDVVEPVVSIRELDRMGCETHTVTGYVEHRICGQRQGTSR